MCLVKTSSTGVVLYLKELDHARFVVALEFWHQRSSSACIEQNNSIKIEATLWPGCFWFNDPELDDLPRMSSTCASSWVLTLGTGPNAFYEAKIMQRLDGPIPRRAGAMWELPMQLGWVLASIHPYNIIRPWYQGIICRMMHTSWAKRLVRCGSNVF